jgi:hypothetical protein
VHLGNLTWLQSGIVQSVHKVSLPTSPCDFLQFGNLTIVVGTWLVNIVRIVKYVFHLYNVESMHLGNLSWLQSGIVHSACVQSALGQKR